MVIYPILRSKYFYLLTTLIFYFLVEPFLIQNQFSHFVVNILLSLIIVLCINIIIVKRFLLFSSILLSLISISSYWVMSFTKTNQLLYVTHYTAILLFLLLMTFFVINAVAQHSKVTKDTLLGAICGYFLLGLTWGEIYLLIDCVTPAAFSDHFISISLRDHAQQFMYYSFETLTTLGYGDILPISDLARTFSWLEAVTGQIYLAVWISQLVGLRIAQVIKKN